MWDLTTFLFNPVLSTTVNANGGGGGGKGNWYKRCFLFELTTDSYFEREGECMLGGLLVLPTEHR